MASPGPSDKQEYAFWQRETAGNLKKCLNRIPGIFCNTEYNTMIEA